MNCLQIKWQLSLICLLCKCICQILAANTFGCRSFATNLTQVFDIIERKDWWYFSNPCPCELPKWNTANRRLCGSLSSMGLFRCVSPLLGLEHSHGLSWDIWVGSFLIGNKNKKVAYFKCHNATKIRPHTQGTWSSLFFLGAHLQGVIYQHSYADNNSLCEHSYFGIRVFIRGLLLA